MPDSYPNCLRRPYLASIQEYKSRMNGSTTLVNGENKIIHAKCQECGIFCGIRISVKGGKITGISTYTDDKACPAGR